MTDHYDDPSPRERFAVVSCFVGSAVLVVLVLVIAVLVLLTTFGD